MIMDSLLNADQVATLLNVKKPTVYSWAHIGVIPHYKVKKVIRFDATEIKEWIKKYHHSGRTTRKVVV